MTSANLDVNGYAAYAARAEGSNVNAKTLLATDYLNHINEIVMLLELVPDCPECVEDCKQWQPLDYLDHFRQSSIADKDLAIEAYPHSPPEYREPFERLIAEMNRVILASVRRLDQIIADGDPEVGRPVAERSSAMLRDLIDQASAIIHGAEAALDQDGIDALMESL